MSVLIVGSVALDDVETPLESRSDLLGGAASYASVAASYFNPVQCVGVVGKDFPDHHLAFFRKRNIDLEGLQVADGPTFRWSGKYHWDLNTRETLSLALNVFADFTPKLPQSYQSAKYVLLGNISPTLQHHVLDQTASPKFVIADTMDHWIDTAKDSLMGLLKRIDMLILNDGEARQLSGKTSLVKAGRWLLEQGPRYIAIKKGEHGCLLFSENQFFSCPAYPLEDIQDPTGAGDTFAGGVAGYLASVNNNGSEPTFDRIKTAIVFGTVMASYNVEAFSLDRLGSLTWQDIEDRVNVLRMFSQFEVLR